MVLGGLTSKQCHIKSLGTHIFHREADSRANCVHGMQAIDLQAEEPRAGVRASDTTSLRVRLSRFNTAVLRVVAADVAGLPDSEQVLPLTSSQGYTFLQIFADYWVLMWGTPCMY